MWRRRSGYSLVEMLTTVAVLVIIFGLMVSLARRVRSASAEELTKRLLRRLDGLMTQYEARRGQAPSVVPLIASGEVEPEEAALQKTALENNREVLAALRSELGPASSAFEGLPDSIYDDAVLRDAWGSPIVFMPSMHPAIGMAPQNRRFFFSAGPDRRFLTQEDNLYSYEDAGPAPRARVFATPSAGQSE